MAAVMAAAITLFHIFSCYIIPLMLTLKDYYYIKGVSLLLFISQKESHDLIISVNLRIFNKKRAAPL
jgi:hypothetical protein